MAAPNEVFVEDDLIYAISYKPTTLESVKAYFAAVEPVFVKHGYAFMLTDATRTFEVSADARRHIAEWGKTHYVVASALFGPSGAALATLTLITSAMRLFGKGESNARFFAKESEARAWLEDQRRQFYARRPRRAEK